jgi:Asp/Glu/hydantoin racemase
VVLGGSRLSPFAEALRKLTPLTVLEPVACAVQLAESLVRLGLTQSKSGKYAPPPQPFESYE